MKILSVLILLAFLAGCHHPNKSLPATAHKQFLMQGDSIAKNTQQILLKNVSAAIKEAGVAEAVVFCNTKAGFLTDSASKSFSVNIQRLTDKPRNPNNRINTPMDIKAWKAIQGFVVDKANPNKDLLVSEGDDIYYYKAIQIGMPTCLSCHGNKNADIATETMSQILQKYPADLATDYKMGELRGMWKIKLQ